MSYVIDVMLLLAGFAAIGAGMELVVQAPDPVVGGVTSLGGFVLILLGGWDLRRRLW